MGVSYVRLDLPSAERVREFDGKCSDEDDWPILADAIDEGCDVVLTYDKKLLQSTAGIRCAEPDVVVPALMEIPEVAAALLRVAATVQAVEPSQAQSAATTDDPKKS